MNEDETKPVTEEDLTFSFKSTRESDGPFASFDEQGRLTSLEYLENGENAGPTLTVDYQANTATLVHTTTKHFPPLTTESLSGEEEIPIETFIRSGIDEVNRSHGEGKYYCCFCYRHKTEVKQLIAGPTTYICNHCVEICGDIITEENQAEKNATKNTTKNDVNEKD